MSIRQIRNKARTELHARLSEAAWYLADENAERVAVTVRLHLQARKVGDLDNGGFAEAVEITPTAIFLLSEIKPLRNAVVVTEDLGAFRLSQVSPPDGVTVSATIEKMSPAKIAGDMGLTPNVPWCGLPPVGA